MSFFLLSHTEALCSTCNIPSPLFSCCFWLGYCNSCLNPFIYASTSREFKRAFSKILCGRRARWPSGAGGRSFNRKPPQIMAPLHSRHASRNPSVNNVSPPSTLDKTNVQVSATPRPGSDPCALNSTWSLAVTSTWWLMALHHRSDNEEHFDICNNKQYRRAFKQENIYKHALLWQNGLSARVWFQSWLMLSECYLSWVLHESLFKFINSAHLLVIKLWWKDTPSFTLNAGHCYCWYLNGKVGWNKTYASTIELELFGDGKTRDLCFVTLQDMNLITISSALF